MPRIRMTEGEAYDAVTAALNAAPNRKLTHRDLITALTSAGKQDAANYVLNFAQSGLLVSVVDADASGRPAAMFSLPVGG